MEKWKEVFIGKIPEGTYQMQIKNGEETGLVIELSNECICTILKFGSVCAVRMLEEGISQRNLYDENEMSKFREGHFKNVIYEITEGKFWNQINDISDGYGEILDLKHYVIVSANYNVDIVTEWEPEIEVLKHL